MVCYIIFAIVLFLVIVNGCLRGRWKQQVDIALGIVICGAISYAVYSRGRMALIYLSVIWLLGGNLIFTPLAKRAARKLLH